MAQIVAPLLSNFNAGQLSPYMDGRVDVAKFGNGAYRMENFIPTVQGPAKRRMGFRFVSEVFDSTARTWLRRFIFSQDQAFILEFSPGKLRFYTNHGILLSGGVPYVVNTPYTASDLTNADGTFGLSFAQTGDVVFIADGRNPLQQLTRLSNTNWTFGAAPVTGGPFEDVKPDNPIKVYSSAATGNVTLTSTGGDAFSADMVGSFFILEQKLTDSYKAWEVNKVVALNDFRRSDSNVYQAVNGGTTGTIKPTHTQGVRSDGDNGVNWRYAHSGYGIVKITGFTSGSVVTGTVINELPNTVLTAGDASSRWAASSWRSSLGHPNLVTFFRERLVLFRKARGWFSVAADFLNFAPRDAGEALPDSAISIDITTSELNDTTFLVPAKRLLVGTVGAEFSIGELSSGEAFGPGNVSSSLQTSHGSRQIPPVIVNDSALFVQRTGRRLRDLRYSFDSDGYQTIDMQVLSTDIARGQMIQTTFQEEPDNVMWACCANGELVGFTFNREQDVIGWHRHPLAENVLCESVETIPSPDGSQDETWAIFRVLVNGVYKRYVGYMVKDWRADESTLSDCIYSDMASSFDGRNRPGTITLGPGFGVVDNIAPLTASVSVFVPGDVGSLVVIQANTARPCRFEIMTYTSATQVTARQIDALPPGFTDGSVSSNWAFGRMTITGLDYLEGREVTVLADGASHPNATVVAGAITLQRHATVAHVGLPMAAEIETMRLEAGAQNGTAQGKIKRIHEVALRFFETLGGKVGASQSDGQETMEEIQFRDSSMPMNQPPAIFTGDKRVHFPQGYTTVARIIVRADQPLPMTLVAIMPQLATHDNGGQAA